MSLPSYLDSSSTGFEESPLRSSVLGSPLSTVDSPSKICSSPISASPTLCFLNSPIFASPTKTGLDESPLRLSFFENSPSNLFSSTTSTSPTLGFISASRELSAQGHKVWGDMWNTLRGYSDAYDILNASQWNERMPRAVANLCYLTKSQGSYLKLIARPLLDKKFNLKWTKLKNSVNSWKKWVSASHGPPRTFKVFRVSLLYVWYV